MTRRRFTMAGLGLLAVATLLTAVYQTAYSQAGRGPSANDSQERLNVRYARASLTLAKLELQRAQNANRRVPGTLPTTVTEPLQIMVQIADAQLDYALHGDAATLHRLLIAVAEAKLKASQNQLQRAVTMSQQAPGAVSPASLELLQAKVEVARLAVEAARAAPQKPSVEELEWQIGELQKQILELNSRVEQLSLLG